jgi:4'-phosphopantetheinyl transferase
MSFALAWPTAQLPQKISPEEIHIWAWPLDIPGPVAALTALLDEDEIQRFHRFHFDRDRLRFAIAHGYLRTILGAYINQPPERLRFKANPYGKPEIAGEGTSPGHPLRFNLSHCRSLALLALSTGAEIGVDVEEIRPIEPGVAESHFSAAERFALGSLDGDSWLRGFYRCWTRKEAILKAEGVGLNLPLDAFDVSLLPDAPAALLGVRAPIHFRYPWKLHTLSPASGTIGALASGSARVSISSFSLPL